jgi:flagellar assembly factor FliW
MPKIDTRYFKQLDYNENAVFHFRAGIPGFEKHTSFIFVEQPHTGPLIFMQSLGDLGLCFIAMAARAIEPEYRLQLTPEEAVGLGMPYSEKPEIGPELLALALITVNQGADPVANLLSPIVLNLKTRRGIQAIQMDSDYSLRHPLTQAGQVLVCS